MSLISTNSVNGSWGEWSDWSECDNICGEGNQTRSRQCDSPAPQYGGEDCQGEDQERQECNKDSHCGKALDSRYHIGVDVVKADKEGEGRGNLVVWLVVIKWGVS